MHSLTCPTAVFHATAFFAGLSTIFADEAPQGPAPIRSAGCNAPLQMPTGAANHFVMPLKSDPLLYDPYRDYYVYVPDGYENTKPLPVVYSYHGFYDSAEGQMTEDRFINLIEDDLPKKDSKKASTKDPRLLKQGEIRAIISFMSHSC